MIGIYLITNNINGKVYVGQSTNIERRWKEHRTRMKKPTVEYDSLLHKAFRKYGIENFSFEVLEECLIKDLDKREIYWIEVLNSNNPKSGYNLTKGGVTSKPISISETTCIEIKFLLREAKMTQQQIADKFGVSQRLISYINDGTLWVDESDTYPIRKKIEHKNFCACGKEIFRGSTHCPECTSIMQRKVERPSKDILEKLIYSLPFSTIGRQYGVSSTTVKRWCKSCGLPYTKSEINNMN